MAGFKRISAVQMASGPNVSANLNEAGRWVSFAADAGAEMVVLPENFAAMTMQQADLLKIQEQEGHGPIQDFLAQLAEKHRIWIVAGTIPLKSNTPDRVRAASLVYNERGEMVARYDKIHLFDASVNEDETYNESDIIEPGDQALVVETPFGNLGVAVCYDLRFPELFRRMLDEQLDIIAIPSAFTAITGRAHWEPLIRARAIENLSYVVASAQGGYHVNGRETYGDSMIVDPWGNILDRLASGSGFVIADLDQDKLAKTRQHFPALDHRRIPCSLKRLPE